MTQPQPPLAVALARPVTELPVRGELAYEPKFDGHRIVSFRTADKVVLQTRSGRFATGNFPDLTTALARLPAGTVLDGEVVVWSRGHTDFAAVQRRAHATEARAAALASAQPASYAVFDLLAQDGQDLRTLPLAERRDRLVALLAPLGPPLQVVPQTLDPQLARAWYESLRPTGIEGLVIKRLDQPYRSGRGEWRKLRHSDTRDAAVVGVVGSPHRPRTIVVVLADDDTPLVCTPPAPPLRERLGKALGDLAASSSETATAGDGTSYCPVPPGLLVEVRHGTTRDATTVVTRLRSPE